MNCLPQFRVELDGLLVHYVHVRASDRRPHPFAAHARLAVDVLGLQGHDRAPRGGRVRCGRTIASGIRILAAPPDGSRYRGHRREMGRADAGRARVRTLRRRGRRLGRVHHRRTRARPRTASPGRLPHDLRRGRGSTCFTSTRRCSPRTSNGCSHGSSRWAASGWALRRSSASGRKRSLTRWSTHRPGQRHGSGSAVGRGARPSGDVLAVFDRDFLCTTASIYWLTRTIGTSIRLYRDHYSHGWKPHHDRTPIVEAPTGFGVYPKDVVFVPAPLAERATNLVRWTVMPRGGHFGPSEQPEAAVEELTTFFHSLRGSA